MMGRVRRVVAAVAGTGILAASMAAVSAPIASAATCTVTNATTGIASTSLQAAANAAAPGTTLRIAGSCKGNVTIGKRLTLLGVGTAPTLRGNGGRPLTITAGPVTVDRLRITGGIATSCFTAPAGVACGGGIASSARLTVKRSLIDGNLASGSTVAHGGGITVLTGGSLKLSGTTVADNSAVADTESGSAFGGGVAAFGPATVTGSRIDGNVVSAKTVQGGGIHSEPAADEGLTVTTTTVIDNAALGANSSQGGGIHALADLQLVRSTVARNSSQGTGLTVSTGFAGGVMAATGSVVNSTITGNIAASDAVAVGGGSVGGLFLTNGTLVHSTIAGNTATVVGGVQLGAVQVRGTIIAGNAGGLTPDCQTIPQTTSAGRNLIGDAAGCGATFDNGVGGDKVGNDNVGPKVAVIVAKLAALANNGGPTFTRALKPGSPAIDAAGGKPCNPAIDQRGVTRPKGAKCDIGAFEKG